MILTQPNSRRRYFNCDYCTHTQTNILFQRGGGHVQWPRADALPWFAPSCAAPLVPRGAEQGPGVCTERKETSQQRQNFGGSALSFLPAGSLDGKWLEHATLSLRPNATSPRGEHCPVAHGINHVFPRDCGTSEQVKQVREEAERFLPFNGHYSKWKWLVEKWLSWAKKRPETAQSVASICRTGWVCS